ncbi:hypothetical protein [[Mycobacterium] vasticus]|uniref:Uncharacterized protein n=1 Tax=[Mycobacterium] vasticus TaxID=2875777 RepID=A0ABU5Z2E3_9MYCO|nr:hypothetical protein [Mycolicibacter sp. MYC017]MEB3071574.1 hypothetical protein [Mycolicibacter sp. MYC017]
MPAQAWVTLIVSGFVAVGVIVTWRQKNRADRRSEWWRRTTWAFERTFSDDDLQVRLGWDILDVLLESALVTADDAQIVQVIARRAVRGESD